MGGTLGSIRGLDLGSILRKRAHLKYGPATAEPTVVGCALGTCPTCCVVPVVIAEGAVFVIENRQLPGVWRLSALDGSADRLF